MTPPGADVESSIQAYGGGAYAIDATRIWSMDHDDDQIHRIDAEGEAAAFSSFDGTTAYGDLTPYQGQLVAIGETADRDRLVQFDADDGSARTLTRTGGFIAAPRPHGDRLAWLSWGADRMPRVATELKAATLRGDELSDAVLVACSTDESVLKPQWNDVYGLTFLSDGSGWWHLYSWDGTDVRPNVTMDADIAAAPWEFGYSSYVHLPGGSIAMTVHHGPRQRLVVHHPDRRRHPTDRRSARSSRTSPPTRTACTASAPHRPPCPR